MTTTMMVCIHTPPDVALPSSSFLHLLLLLCIFCTALAQELEAAVQEELEAEAQRAARKARRRPPPPLHLPVLGEADQRTLLCFTDLFPGKTYPRHAVQGDARRRARRRAAKASRSGGAALQQSRGNTLSACPFVVCVFSPLHNSRTCLCCGLVSHTFITRIHIQLTFYRSCGRGRGPVGAARRGAASAPAATAGGAACCAVGQDPSRAQRGKGGCKGPKGCAACCSRRQVQTRHRVCV